MIRRAVAWCADRGTLAEWAGDLIGAASLFLSMWAGLWIASALA